MAPQELRLGTRGSPLALWQAREVARRIADAGGPACRIVVIRTSGDRLQEAPLSEVGGKRLFIKEIEDALLQDAIDLAVHSSKDMPAELPNGLMIAGVLPREDPHDAVVLPLAVRLKPDPASAPTSGAFETSLSELLAILGASPSIGTGSVRRVSQLRRLLPGARFTPIRGNLDTRLRKLDEGSYQALVLAAAGLKRLGFTSRISMTLDAADCVPAPGQGIVAIETREDHETATKMAAMIDDGATRAALEAERAVVVALGGGCQMPIGALASPVGRDEIEVTAIVLSLDGTRAIRATGRGPIGAAAGVGASVGERLIADGAGSILAEVQSPEANRRS